MTRREHLNAIRGRHLIRCQALGAAYDARRDARRNGGDRVIAAAVADTRTYIVGLAGLMSRYDDEKRAARQ